MIRSFGFASFSKLAAVGFVVFGLGTAACGATGEQSNGLTPVPSNRCLYDGKSFQNGERACHDGIEKECRDNSARGADGVWAETGNKCKGGDIHT